jgi:hypothetical protein
VGTGEALGGPGPAGFGKQCLPITGDTGKWWAATRESEGVVVPLDGAGQHNPAGGKGPCFIDAGEARRDPVSAR